MIARELIDTAQVPGGEELRLFRHGRDFMIVLDRNELMSTRMSGSEQALATMSCERIAGQRAPHLLIGGYGMGFTLRAALAMLGPDAKLTVAELVPQIIEWARGPMAEVAAGCLDDPRVRLIEEDVGLVIANARATYDAILLDVDNGPDGLVRQENNRIYSRQGLLAAREALRPGGVLAIWSAGPDPAFSARLHKAGFDVEEVAVRARSNGKGAKHVIWFARQAKRAGSPMGPATGQARG
ncbi:spermidine synthase [Altererythrobacter sp. CC-YST694]|uniref:spermidine synthase n=1 Tax=Altererythrobacter sp. CC-YST694 TaxID=2755038 RepID=UPI001D014093|nr:spermidine synthase [Altererythrobacter sp. CC-YST694]MCB5425747.1 spermidine synthase [Altererythrobacter sp. CC-YST694]